MSLLPPLPPLNAAQSITLPTQLDAVRSKLEHLLVAISHLLNQLHHASMSTPIPTRQQPGILPYPELLSRYNLLLSHLSSLSSLLSSSASSQEEARQLERRKEDRGRDERKEKWSGSIVVPAEQVEEQRDWIVGMLLRTKQTPAVESHLSTLLSSLPSSLSLPSAQATHRALTRNAFDRITSLAQGIDGEEWDWKGRVEVDEEEEDEAEGGDTEMKEEPEREKGAQWTVQEVATFQRTGRLPGHAQQSQTS